MSIFGQDVQSDTMCDSSRSSVLLNYNDTSQPRPSPTPAPSDHAIAQTLFLLERFGVSDEFYHELAMINPTLSRYMSFMICYDHVSIQLLCRIHKVKRLRKSISSDIDIKPLPSRIVCPRSCQMRYCSFLAIQLLLNTTRVTRGWYRSRSKDQW